jgi:hypothetical protein
MFLCVIVTVILWQMLAGEEQQERKTFALILAWEANSVVLK